MALDATAPAPWRRCSGAGAAASPPACCCSRRSWPCRSSWSRRSCQTSAATSACVSWARVHGRELGHDRVDPSGGPRGRPLRHPGRAGAGPGRVRVGAARVGHSPVDARRDPRTVPARPRRRGLYAVSLGTVAKTYPDELRPRVLALLRRCGSCRGWSDRPSARWSRHDRVAVRLRRAAAGVVATWALIAPVLDLVPRPERSGPGSSLRWPSQLMIGAGFVFASLTVVAWWVPVAVLAGLAIGVPALRHIAPPGTFTARPGLRRRRRGPSSCRPRSSRWTPSSR